MLRRQATIVLATLLFTGPAWAGGSGWGTVIFHAINLALLLLIIVKVSRPKVKVALEMRAAAVSADIEEASRLHVEAEALLAEYEEKVSGLDAEIEALKAQYKAQGEAERARLIEEGRAEAERLVRDAERSAQGELVRLRAKLEAEVVDRAIDAAAAAISEKMTAADQRRLTADYLSRLEEATRA